MTLHVNSVIDTRQRRVTTPEDGSFFPEKKELPQVVLVHFKCDPQETNTTMVTFVFSSLSTPPPSLPPSVPPSIPPSLPVLQTSSDLVVVKGYYTVLTLCIYGNVALPPSLQSPFGPSSPSTLPSMEPGHLVACTL